MFCCFEKVASVNNTMKHNNELSIPFWMLILTFVLIILFHLAAWYFSENPG